jgi:hypothetical protein
VQAIPSGCIIKKMNKTKRIITEKVYLILLKSNLAGNKPEQ